MEDRKRLTRRQLLRSSGLAVGAAALAGCAAATPQVVEKVVKETVVVETVVTPTAAVTAPTTVTASFWAYPEQMAEFQMLLDAFAQKEPLVKPEIIPVPVGEYWQKLQTMIAGGTEPNLMYLSAYWFPALAEKSLVLEIDPFIEASNWDMSIYWEQTLEAFKWEAKQYGLPYVLTPLVIIYNKTLFDEAGLQYPPSDLSDADWWTWDTMLEAALALTKQDASGRPTQFGCQFSPTYWVDIHNFPWQNGGKVLNDEKTACLLDSAESTEALTWHAELATKHQVCPNVGQATADIGFNVGNIGLRWFAGSQLPGLRKQATEFEWDIAHLPTKAVRDGVLISECFAISKAAPSPEAAWMLMSYLCGDEGQMLQAYHPRSMPSTRAAAQKFVELAAELPPASLQVYVDSLAYTRYPDITTKWDEMITTIGKELERAWIGEQSPDQACKVATENVNRLLAG
ncbi:MAG: sugar ABC transporter substrate-binding protein [Anaerolineae bacterium]|nr:sugar ABC transporter substrate-binding protein [Anaerolineae bacterium]